MSTLWEYVWKNTSKTPTEEVSMKRLFVILCLLLMIGGVCAEIGADTPSIPAPICKFATSVTSGPAPLSVKFTDVSGDKTITAWEWNFGDGETSKEQNPTHIYNKIGGYKATLTVYGSYVDGGDENKTQLSSTASVKITVTKLNIENKKPVVGEVSSVTISDATVKLTEKSTGLTVTSSTKVNGVAFVPAITSTSDGDLKYDGTEGKILGIGQSVVSIKYEYSDTMLKETITLISDKQITIPISGGVAVPLKSGAYRISNGGNWWSGIVIQKPYGIDNNGKYIEMSYGYDGKELSLNYDRVDIAYPLVIDPTYVINGDTFKYVHPNKFYGNTNATVPIRYTIWNTVGANVSTDIHLGPNIKSDFRDIRFMNEDATVVLPAYLNIMNDTVAEVFVNAPLTTTGNVVNLFFNSSTAVSNWTTISALKTITSNPYYSQDEWRNYSYNGVTEVPVSQSFQDLFGDNTGSRYANASATTGANWVAGATGDVTVGGGAITLASDNDMAVSARLKSYKFAGGEYEFSFDNNNDGGSVTDFTGAIIATQDLSNHYRIVVGNDTVAGTSNLSIWKDVAGTYTLVNVTDTSAIYTRSNKNWMKIKFDPNQGLTDVWLRDDAGSYTTAPVSRGFVSSYQYGYFGFYSSVATVGGGNLNIVFDDLTVKAALLIGETNIPAYETGFYLYDTFDVDSHLRYPGDQAGFTVTGGRLQTIATAGAYRADAPSQLSSTSDTALVSGIVKFPAYNGATQRAYFYLHGTKLGANEAPDGGYSYNSRYVVKFYRTSAVAGFYTILKITNGATTELKAATSTTLSDATDYTIQMSVTSAGLLRVYKDGVQLGADITDTTLKNGSPGVGTFMSSNDAVQFDNLLFTGTRYYMKPMLRGSQIGEYYNGVTTVQTSRFTDDTNWATNDEWTILSSAVWDTTNGRVSIPTNTDGISTKTNIADFVTSFDFYKGSATDIVAFGFDSQGGAPLTSGSGTKWILYDTGAAFRFRKYVSNVLKENPDFAYPASGFGVGLHRITISRIGTKINVKIDGQTNGAVFPYDESTARLTATPLTYGGEIITTGSYLSGIVIDYLDSTSTNGVSASLGGVPHGARYDTNEYAGVSFTNSPPTNYNVSLPSKSTITTSDASLNQLVFTNTAGTGFSNVSANAMRALSVVGSSTILGFDNENLQTTVAKGNNYLVYTNFTNFAGTAYDQRGRTMFFNPVVYTTDYNMNAPAGSVWANFSSNVSGGTIFLPVGFTDASEFDPEYPITTWNWSFGNGNYSDAQNPSTTYYHNGTYPVTLTVSSSVLSDSLTRYITVNGSAKFTYTPIGGVALQSVHFTDTTDYYAPDTWNWSATNVTGNNVPYRLSTAQNPLIKFREGNFSIRLNATNSVTGVFDTSDISWVNVSGLTVDFVAGTTNYACSKNVFNPGVCVITVPFEGWWVSGSTPNMWNWSWGDGSWSNGTVLNQSHVYNLQGIYTVKLIGSFSSDPTTTGSMTKADYIRIGESGPGGNIGYTIAAEIPGMLFYITCFIILAIFIVCVMYFKRPDNW